MGVLVGVDVVGVQRYIFASQRLRDILAASWMVEQAMSKKRACELGVEPDCVLLAAGGNMVLEFADEEMAKDWVSRYTRWLLEGAPGLEVTVAICEEGSSLAERLMNLMERLQYEKMARVPGVRGLGLGVTARCAYTGSVAVGYDEEGKPISGQIKVLRRVHEDARGRWKGFLLQSGDCDFPVDLDDLGRSRGDVSLMGVVHVDGNGVGRAIQDWLNRCVEGGVEDGVVREQYKEWSYDLRRAGEVVLESLIGRVTRSIEDARVKGYPRRLSFELRGRVFLPIRPIILGGDDLTFVCDGRIALDLAAAAIREFGKQRIRHLEDGGWRLTACAGVAVVRTHTPFSMAYRLSEALCKNAKKERKEHGAVEGWLDWHIGDVGHVEEPIPQMRKRLYKAGQFELTMRPYPIKSDDGTPDREPWDWLEKKVLGVGSEDGGEGFRDAAWWAKHRNRVKKLALAVREGPDAVRQLVKMWRAVDENICLPVAPEEGGFFGEKTPLLDAIELMDLHLSLEE